MRDWTKEKEAAALDYVATPAKFKKRMKETISVLRKDIRDCFKNPVFDFEGKTCAGAGYVLKWQTRPQPNEPESYENQQTTRGTVYVYELKGGR